MDAAVEHRDTSSQPSHPHDTLSQRFGATVRQYRQQRGLSQRTLAAHMGLHYRYMSKIELGQHTIGVLLLFRLAHALDIPAICLLAELNTHVATAPPPPYVPRISSETRETDGTDDATVLLSLLGETVRHYRQQRHLSQQALAVKTGLATSYVFDIEHGQRNVSLLSLLRLADALGLSVAHLLAPLDTRPVSSLPCAK
jgi:transcriptional regulator with XRE-family HTH domain